MTRRKKSLSAVAAALGCCIAVIWFSTSIQGRENTYEIRPNIAVPYGYTPTIDAYRLIDLIEHLVNQNQQITQNRLTGIGTDIQIIAEELDSIDAKLTELCKTMAGLEKALGLKQPEPANEKEPVTRSEHKKPHRESSSTM